jgi:aryl-alcohol dehydrogenase-like predicted oxidoreductase
MTTQATAEGTRRLRDRLQDRLHPSAFSETNGLFLSSLGLGTYLGEPDEATDEAYLASIKAALEAGCNVLDTAVNYRYQRSERVVGQALAESIATGTVQRDEIVVATKGGFIAFDTSRPDDPKAWFQENFVDTGLAAVEDVVAGCHLLTPAYLANELDKSLANLRLDSVDVYYLHNPETQLSAIDAAAFLTRMRAAFEMLEQAVADGKAGAYGLATWNGFRNPPETDQYLSLQELAELAGEVGGKDHHFRYVQLPVNFGMLEAYAAASQKTSADGKPAPFLTVAADLGLTVMSSGSILQGRFAAGLPPELRKALGNLPTDAQNSLQFVRSLPGLHVALVGSSNPDHVRENLAVLTHPRLSPATIATFFE